MVNNKRDVKALRVTRFFDGKRLYQKSFQEISKWNLALSDFPSTLGDFGENEWARTREIFP